MLKTVGKSMPTIFYEQEKEYWLVAVYWKLEVLKRNTLRNFLISNFLFPNYSMPSSTYRRSKKSGTIR